MARGFGSTKGSGTTDSVTSSLTDSEPTAITISVWINRNGSGGGSLGRVAEKGTTTLYWANAQTRIAYIRTTSGTQGQWRLDSSNGWSTGQWANVVITHDTSSGLAAPAAYWDGASSTLTLESTPTGSWATNSNAWIIGNRSDDARVWDGTIGEFAIWSRILSAGEIAALGKGFSPLSFPASLVECIPMVRDNISIKRAAPTITGTAVQNHPRIIRPSAQILQFPSAAAAANTVSYYQRQTFGIKNFRQHGPR